MNEEEITNLEKIKQLYGIKFIKYFNKYFSEKDVLNSLDERIKDTYFQLTSLYLQFGFLIESIEIIKENENLSEDDKSLLNDYIVCFEFIIKEFNTILMVII